MTLVTSPISHQYLILETALNISKLYKQVNLFSRSEVHDSLFSATKASQQAILLVRSLCEKSCSSISGVGEGKDGICLLYTDNQITFTLKDFVEAQSKQAQEAKEKLAALRVKVLEIVKEACEVGAGLCYLLSTIM